MTLLVFQLLTGVVFFLLGFRFIEEAVQTMTGRSFKLYLKKQTTNLIKAVVGGATITAFLQSSSIVNFLILSFVGAGVLKMKQALALTLGANLGTTLNSWIIAWVGFKVDLEGLAFPLISLFGLIYLLYPKVNKVLHWSRLLLGMGFLFFGLDFIKNSVSDSLLNYDLNFLSSYPLVVFVLFGLIATTLTQASSVTMAISLSALNGGGISLVTAMAIILGAEVGTTLKLVLASLNGPAAKKKVAYSNFIFNVITVILALVLIYPTQRLIKTTFGIEDNLIALVFYQSLVNLFSILLFLPALNRIGNWLDKYKFKSEEETNIIHKVKVEEGDFAHSALDQETTGFLSTVLYFSRKSFELPALEANELNIPKRLHAMDRSQGYTHLKKLHGEIRNYALELYRTTLDQDKLSRIGQLLETIRDGMYAIKNIKDIFQDIDLLSNSSNDIKYGIYQDVRKKFDELTRTMVELLKGDRATPAFEELIGEIKKLEFTYNGSIQRFYKEGLEMTLTANDFSTLINFNRETFNASKYLVIMVKEFVLEPKRSEEFDELLHHGI